MNNQVPTPSPPQVMIQKKRKAPGKPDPKVGILALSPGEILDAKKFECEICYRKFLRAQNLGMHRKTHNLPTKLQRSGNKEQKAYVCPVETCDHHSPSRALRDFSAIKKHYIRKHVQEKFKCSKCPKSYSVLLDLNAHLKVCGTREYNCTICSGSFPRKDSYNAHWKFCDALAARTSQLRSLTNLQTAPTVPGPATWIPLPAKSISEQVMWTEPPHIPGSVPRQVPWNHPTLSDISDSIPGPAMWIPPPPPTSLPPVMLPDISGSVPQQVPGSISGPAMWTPPPPLMNLPARFGLGPEDMLGLPSFRG